MWAYWITASCILLILEFITVSFAMVFFAFAAFVAFLASLFTDNVIVQIIVFIVVSALSIPFGRPMLQKYFNINKEIKPSTIDALIGKNCVVTKTISQNQSGMVKVNGEVWTALTNDKTDINEGEIVTIISVDGVKLIVSRINE